MRSRHDRSAPRRRDGRRPEVLGLENRTLLATVGGVPIEAGPTAYVTQLYYDLLDRAPDGVGLPGFSQAIEADPGARVDVVAAILGSDEFRGNQIQGLYQDLLGRDPDPFGTQAFDDLLRQDDFDIDDARAIVFGSDEYFQTQAGGTQEGFLRALYSDALGRGIDPVGLNGFLDALQSGVSRARVASAVLNSVEADQNLVEGVYADLLFRSPDGVGGPSFLDALQGGLTESEFLGAVVLSPEYVDTTSAITQDLVELASGADALSTLVQAVQAADLVETLQGPGPFTIFAPTDAAFDALPDGTLDTLLANPDQLAEVLLYHVVPGTFSSPEVIGAGALPTAQGSLIGIRQGGDAGVTINTSDLVATDLRAVNGVVHLIDEVLMVPQADIVQTAVDAGSFSTLVQAVQAADLVETLQGPGPFTIFAPTDAAFDALPDGALDELLANPDQLTEVLLYHVVADQALSTTDLTVAGRVETAQGATVDISRTADGDLVINESDVVVQNIITTNGIIQAIDAVLIPPA